MAALAKLCSGCGQEVKDSSHYVTCLGLRRSHRQELLKRLADVRSLAAVIFSLASEKEALLQAEEMKEKQGELNEANPNHKKGSQADSANAGNNG